MRLLYIDTSSSYLYTGIVENDKLLAETKELLEHDLSRLALPKIADMFTKTNLNPKDIDKIIVVNGPGSFTGIRVGLTIAKVYAWTLNIPITTITSLEAMAVSSNSNKVVVPMIDARRDYSFAAIYENDNEILKPCHIENNKLKTELDNHNNYVIISNDDIKLDGDKEKYNPDILKIVTKYKDKKEINPHFVNPNYLKLTEAEEKLQSWS